MKAIGVLIAVFFLGNTLASAVADPTPRPKAKSRTSKKISAGTGQQAGHLGRGLDIARVDGQIVNGARPQKKLKAKVNPQSASHDGFNGQYVVTGVRHRRKVKAKKQTQVQTKWFLDHAEAVKHQSARSGQTVSAKPTVSRIKRVPKKDSNRRP